MRNGQRTICQPVDIEGVGLHTGEHCQLRLKPAAVNTGVVFVRTDIPDAPPIPATVDYLVARPRRTALRNGSAEVHTIEHLLSAATALEVHNLEIEMSNVEVPGADGSALPFVELLTQAGFEEQDESVDTIVLEEPVAIRKGDTTIVALPSKEGMTVSYTMIYDHPFLGTQHFESTLTPETFLQEIAPARTFCLESEVEQLRELGLGMGANTENTLVMGANGVLDNELRFADECVRHKVLDLIGDLSLMGKRLQAHVVATRSGHATNVELAQKILNLEKKKAVGDRGCLDIQAIQKILPHRYPFLLIDRVIEVEDNRRAVGIKNVTINEPYFQGHWPGRPVMPGVLQLEAMAQLAGVLLMRDLERAGKLAVILSIDKVRLRKVVSPGDQLRLECRTVRLKARTGKVHGRATVEGEQVAEAQFLFMLLDGE
ncbi:MAG: UDP-3-O-acyl-N-acetylglucosamine deacetylase [Planctomycetota bacterium]|nr:UDP-3-O-acyl-N-acetylglucosamine deacetylase [Planctomycetota bacterium]